MSETNTIFAQFRKHSKHRFQRRPRDFYPLLSFLFLSGLLGLFFFPFLSFFFLIIIIVIIVVVVVVVVIVVIVVKQIFSMFI